MKNSKSYIIFISIVAAIGGILFGYDTAVISGTISTVTNQFALDAIQQGWYVGSALIGSIIGVSFAGLLSDSIGRKKTMLLSAALFTISAIGCAFCPDFSQLVIYRIIGGLGIGIVSIVSPIYISEVSPAEKRGRMVSMYQFAVTVGFLAAYFTNYLIIKNTGTHYTGIWKTLMSDETWRGMLGSEIFVAVLFFFIIFFIPESPRWVSIKSSKKEDTKKENWKMLLEPGIIKAIIIGAAIAILGQFMGVNAVLYYGPSIFENAGLSSGDSMFSQVLVGIVNMFTTIIALIIIDKIGRKKLIYWGVSGMILSLLSIGIYFALGASIGLSNGFLLSSFLFYVFCCAISISAVVFVLLSEMYPNNVRGRAMSIAGLSLWIGTFLIGQLTPWMLSTLKPAGTFFFFAFMCLPYIIIMWRCVPETTGKSLEEIEKYWIKK